MTILCATHFSDAAQRAATAAAELARKLNEPLFLVHVLPGDLARAFGKTLQDTAMSALRDEVQRLEKLGTRVSFQLLTGEPAEELARFAEEKGAGLVVTAGPTSASPFLGVGGTVDRLATALPVPLLVVRDAEPFEAWVRETRPLRVMLGVDRSQPFEAARDWLQRLRRYGQVEVVAGRIYWPHEEYQRMGLAHPMSFQDVTPELRRALEQEVRTLAGPLEAAGQPPVRVRLEPGVGRIADHLVTLAADEKVDVLVVGSHQRRALGKLWSVSHHALRLAKMSVASVPVAVAARGVAVPIPVLRSVLVATDFSDAANRAIPYAFSLLPNGGSVYLVTVGEPPQATEHERELRQRLHQLVPRDADGHGRKVQVEVLTGQDVATAILQAAQRFDADVLCLGTHGRTGLKTSLMGSVAKAVMSRSDRPVLVVRPPES
ncbi:universal stress protein [Vitiosangium sp. GDMCC 1.1324]|uniref:universal stress protein n=1 Tax=Vitiosangium sp. (strain GDMCC 1.1324) TaxID=2138576 RepID=UPI000D35384B|nr:universal stress protein [Vitiosangium sp. GDMCC 1.1324]PTL83432.1 universal stress protein [Vitiosangium sp. GDMCC 1.1324]